MTTPKGDLPDWETLVTPLMLTASQNNIGPNNNVVVHSDPAPFRVWGCWLSVSAATSSGYTSGVQTIGAQISDIGNNVLLRCQLHVFGANNTINQALAIPVNGFVSSVAAMIFQINLITDVGFTGLFFRANAGILYSKP